MGPLDVLSLVSNVLQLLEGSGFVINIVINSSTWLKNRNRSPSDEDLEMGLQERQTTRQAHTQVDFWAPIPRSVMLKAVHLVDCFGDCHYIFSWEKTEVRMVYELTPISTCNINIPPGFH